MQRSPLPTTVRPASGAGYDQRDVRTMQNPVLLVCVQRLDNMKEQKSFKLKLPVCFLCLEKYSACGPNRGILLQELNFAFASQKLEVTWAQGVM